MKRKVNKKNLQWSFHLFPFSFKRNTLQILVSNSGMSYAVEKIHAENLWLLIIFLYELIIKKLRVEHWVPTTGKIIIRGHTKKG